MCLSVCPCLPRLKLRETLLLAFAHYRFIFRALEVDDVTKTEYSKNVKDLDDVIIARPMSVLTQEYC